MLTDFVHIGKLTKDFFTLGAANACKLFTDFLKVKKGRSVLFQLPKQQENFENRRSLSQNSEFSSHVGMFQNRETGKVLSNFTSVSR